MNGDMTSVSETVQIEEFSAPESSMLLRERVKRLMGNDLHASWKSLPEVKSSGLLEMLSERKIALEELKFCLITCEVVYNSELAELLSLSKRSVSWADPLPSFNRQTIASTIEKVKRCSDGFLSTFEKQWNMKPVVNLTVLHKMFEDMVPQLQNYVTYCNHQEDLCAVLHTAMRSKYEIVAASFSNRLNVERVMLPLQHLRLYRLLFQDIHSMLLSTTNRLDSFYCKRILTDITKLLEECYKVLRSLHGSRYVEKLNRILEENVHGFEAHPAGCDTSKHQENNLSGTSVVCGKVSSDSVEDTDSKCSERGTLPQVNVNGCPSVKHQCLNLQTIERNSRDVVQCGDKFNMMVKREDPIEVCGRKAAGVALTCRSLPSNRERCMIHAEVQPTKNSYKRNSYLTKPKYSVSEFADSIHNTSVEGRRRCSCLYETESRSGRNEGSKKHITLFENRVKISIDNNKTLHIISSNNCNDKPPHTTTSHHLCIPNLSENLTNSGPESSSVKHVITRCSVHDKLKVKNCQIHNSCLQPSKMQIHSAPSLRLQYNNCEKLSEQCNPDEQLDTRFVLNKPTSPVPPPLKPLLIKGDAVSFKDDLHTNSVQRESESFTHEANREVHCKSLHEEEKCSDHFSLLKYGSASSDIPSSISPTEEAAANKSCISKKLPRHEQQIFISSYDLGCLGVLCEPQLPLLKANTRMDEIYNHYEPMNEFFRRSSHELEPVSHSESLDRKVNSRNRTECDKGQKTYVVSSIRVDDCGNAYEECKPCDINHMNGDNLNNRTPSSYDAPLYQAYNFGGVKHSNTKVEENIYTEPDEPVYEEINFPLKPEPQSNDKEVSIPRLEISKPFGSSQRVRWVDITEVMRSGLLDNMDASQIALQETKYEMITSEISYYMSLSILETVFITSNELTDRTVLPEEDHATLFSSIRKVKQCSEKFLEVLLDGWQEDLALGYLCHAVSTFVSSDNLRVYVDCCANQIYRDKTLQLLKLTNCKFTNAVLNLEADPACQMFSLQTFLTLPMQRVTRLPMVVQAIIRRLPSNHIEHGVWSETLVQLQKIVKECNEAAGKAQTLATQLCNHHVQPNVKTQSLNMKQHFQEMKQKTVWKMFTLGKQKVT